MNSYILILFLFLSYSSFSQSDLDSYFDFWKDESNSDSLRVQAFTNYIWRGYMFSNPDSAIILSHTMRAFGEQKLYPRAVFAAYDLLGTAYQNLGDFLKAKEYATKTLRLAEKNNDRRSIAFSSNNLASAYLGMGNNAQALKNLQKSLEIFEEIDESVALANSANNIGIIYSDVTDYPKALEYFHRSLQTMEESGDDFGASNALLNIGAIYNEQGDYLKALEYFQRSLENGKKHENKFDIAGSLLNLGMVYQNQGELTRSLENYKASLRMYEELGDQERRAETLKQIGLLHNEGGDYRAALDFCNRSYILCDQIGSLYYKRQASQCLYDSYKALRIGNSALKYLEEIKALDDSLDVQETTKKLQQMEFEKAMLADSLEQVAKDLEVQHAHDMEVEKKNKTRNYLIGGGLFFVLLAGGFFSRWRYVRKAKAVVEKEKDRSNNLLLNILPADIAEELKIHGKAEARDFDMVSILFSDFKEFTQTAEKLSAKELVDEINTCFEAFDAIMGKYGVEKIKTIGDAYMAAGGLPVQSDDSVKNTVLAALEMQDFINQRKAESDAIGKPAFLMRVGIHTGPVVAGIVGVKKFQYDIWGDTVNTASRMESNGNVGKVNISQSTYELIKDAPEFQYVSRGHIDVKGKGEVQMWFVDRAV